MTYTCLYSRPLTLRRKSAVPSTWNHILVLWQWNGTQRIRGMKQSHQISITGDSRTKTHQKQRDRSISTYPEPCRAECWQWSSDESRSAPWRRQQTASDAWLHLQSPISHHFPLLCSTQWQCQQPWDASVRPPHTPCQRTASNALQSTASVMLQHFKMCPQRYCNYRNWNVTQQWSLSVKCPRKIQF